MNATRRTFVTSAAAAVAAGAFFPARAANLPSLGGSAFGSYWRLVPGAGPVPTGIVEDIAAVIRSVDAAMSPYRFASELMRLNRFAGRDWMALSQEVATVLSAALDIADSSGGAFDPTVGPLVARYGFGPIRQGRAGGLDTLELDGMRLRKSRADTTLDLCGIAKGWALDRIVALLDARGMPGFLVELGGEVFARGAHPEGRAWRVAIDGTSRSLELQDFAVATSGIAAQSYRVGPRVYGHIIDPRFGEPAKGDLFSVSVLARTAMKADAWATALFSRGHERGIDMAEAQGIDAVFSVWDGPELRIFTTGPRAAAAMTAGG